MASALDLVFQKEKSIDVIINNAGMGIAGDIEHTTLDKDKEQVETCSLQGRKKTLTSRGSDAEVVGYCRACVGQALAGSEVDVTRAT